MLKSGNYKFKKSIEAERAFREAFILKFRLFFKFFFKKLCEKLFVELFMKVLNFNETSNADLKFHKIQTSSARGRTEDDHFGAGHLVLFKACEE